MAVQENASRANALALVLDFPGAGVIDDSLLEELFYGELVDLHSRGFYPADNRFVPITAFLLPALRTINKIRLDQLYSGLTHYEFQEKSVVRHSAEVKLGVSRKIFHHR